MRIYTGVGHTDSESAQHFLLGKTLGNVSCAPDGDGVRTSGLWIASPMLFPLIKNFLMIIFFFDDDVAVVFVLLQRIGHTKHNKHYLQIIEGVGAEEGVGGGGDTC